MDEETIKDYRHIIKWSDNVYERLAIEELLDLLAECTGDESIIKEVDKYIEDFDKWVNIICHQAEAVNKICNIIEDYKKQCEAHNV